MVFYCLTCKKTRTDVSKSHILKVLSSPEEEEEEEEQQEQMKKKKKNKK